MAACLHQPVRELSAVVDGVLPRTGLAYLHAEDGSEWTITKSTAGPGLDGLAPGSTVRLAIERAAGFELVAAYTAD